MKVVILAGGFGTRMAEYTKAIPKPMVKINGLPMIVHIMKHYSSYGFNDFYIAYGYKGKIIKDYFKKKTFNWNIKLINTGLKTMTGGRLKKIAPYLKDETFLLTYGDGLSDVNINKLIEYHKKNRKLITLTAVRPPARFGAIKIEGKIVKYFKEKSQIDEGWINGGFFVIEKKFLKYIKNESTILEKEPMEIVTKKKQLTAYKHKGFWQCFDTKRDIELMNQKLTKN
jgi:glucose-1-phosphate cytidylyltransferase